MKMRASYQDIGVLKRVNGTDCSTRASTMAKRDGGSHQKQTDSGALDAAKNLEKFLKNQKKRMGGKTAKHEWLLSWQKLIDEEGKSDRLLQTSLASPFLETILRRIESGSGGIEKKEQNNVSQYERKNIVSNDAAGSIGFSSGVGIIPTTSEMERLALHREVDLLSAMVAACGEDSSMSREDVRLEIDSASNTSKDTLQMLQDEETEIQTELSRLWPSVIAGRSSSGLNEAVAEEERFRETLKRLLTVEHQRSAKALESEIEDALAELEQRRTNRIAAIEQRQRLLHEEAKSLCWRKSKSVDSKCSKATPSSFKVQKDNCSAEDDPSSCHEKESSSTVEAASRAAYWLGARRRLAAAKRSAAIMCSDDRRFILSIIKKLLVNMDEALKEAEKEAVESLRRDERQRELKRTLEVAKAKKYFDDIEIKLREDQENERIIMEMKRKEKEFNSKLDAQKILVAAFQRERQVRREVEEAQRREDELREQELIASRAEFNAERVDFRKRLLEERAKSRREEQLAAEEADKARVQRINAIASQVGITAEQDPNRILKKTASLEIRETSAQAKELFPVHGYSNDELMRDESFKVGLAIREAGLHTSVYAREALQSLSHARRDNIRSQF